MNIGAPVEYRGMRIGTVEQAPAQLKKNGEPIYFEHDNTLVPVLIKIEYGRIYEDETLAKQYWQKNLEKWIGSQPIIVSLDYKKYGLVLFFFLKK